MNTVIYSAWLLLPAIASLGLLMLLALARTEVARRVAITLFLVSLVGAALWVTLAGWLLRDGLGPESTDSDGAEALARFAHETGLPIGVLVGLAVAGLLISRGKRQRLAAPPPPVPSPDRRGGDRGKMDA